jgi:formate/nitrite transporter FocA (FNT family)
MKTLLINRIQKNSRLSISNTCLCEIVLSFQAIMHILVENLLWRNLLPVTLGNIIGGAVLV